MVGDWFYRNPLTEAERYSGTDATSFGDRKNMLEKCMTPAMDLVYGSQSVFQNMSEVGLLSRRRIMWHLSSKPHSRTISIPLNGSHRPQSK